MNSIGNGIPFDYDYINAYTAPITPSTVHVRDTGLARYFKRYLLQKAISVFKWELPKTWSRDYFLYVLYCWGFLAVVNTDKYGAIPQACGLQGYDVFYRPTTALITNPALKGFLTPRIGIQCTLFKLQPDFHGILDLVNYFGDMMALCSETVSTNLINSHTSNVFAAESKQAAESLKKMFDKVASGAPAVFADKSLFNEDGSPRWSLFNLDIGSNYIVDKVLADMRKIECMFDTEIGIPNANTDKRERLISDEVNSNNIETGTRCELWLESLQQSCIETNKMFGLDISVDWRVDPRGEEVKTDESNSVTAGDV